MQAREVPAPLYARLGPEATAGLLDLLHDMREDMTRYVVEVCTERFERRLVEETSKLRVDISARSSDLLKWMFLFWIGQVAAMAAILNLVVRGR